MVRLRWPLLLTGLVMGPVLLCLVVGLGGFVDRASDHEVTAVTDGSTDGTVVVTVAREDGLPSTSREWTLDDDGDISLLTEGPAGPARIEDCVDRYCYRAVAGALRVEVSQDGGATYETAWQVDGDTYAELARAYDRLGDPTLHLTSRAVVAHPVEGGHVVFVANGRDGVLYRDVAGAWHRLGIPMGGEGTYFQPPPPLRTDPRPADPRPYIGFAVLVIVLVMGLVRVAVRRSLPSPPRAGAVFAVAAVAGVIAGLAAGFPAVGMLPGFLYALMIIGATLACAIVLVLSVLEAPIWRAPPRSPGSAPVGR
jgi:hypothetical protein